MNPDTVVIPSTPAPESPKSNKLHSIITVLCLILFWPLGVILMWVWTGWPKWLKIVLTLLPIVLIAILGILAAVVVTSINPVEKIAEARNAKRRQDVENIATAVTAYQAEHIGLLPLDLENVFATRVIGSGLGEADLCPMLLQYIKPIPVDPGVKDSTPLVDCSVPYSTHYTVAVDPQTKQVIVAAPDSELFHTISTAQ